MLKYLSVKKDVPASDYWDQTLIDDLFKHVEGNIIVIPGAYQFDVVDEINKELNKYPWCVVIVTSDEENKFPIDHLKHPKMKIYATYPNLKYKNVDRWLPIGYTKNTRKMIKFNDKNLDWFFSGQVNHEDRIECVRILRHIQNDKTVLSETDGFSKGLVPQVYYDYMCHAKIIPAPRGNISPDSFRLYEALECGSIPIPQDPMFWDMLFTSVPFPVIGKYEQLKGYIQDALE